MISEKQSVKPTHSPTLILMKHKTYPKCKNEGRQMWTKKFPPLPSIYKTNLSKNIKTTK